MKLGSLLFYLLAIMVLLPAVYVAVSKHVVRAGFALIAAFFGIAALFAWLGADFLAGTQVMVYAGGILVLLLFGVMLTQQAFQLQLPGKATRLLPAALLSAGIGGVLIFVALTTPWAARPPDQPEPTTGPLGQLFLTRFVIPFEVASVVLLAVIVGAAVIARRDYGRKQ